MFFDELMVNVKTPDTTIVTFENSEYGDEPLTYRDLS